MGIASANGALWFTAQSNPGRIGRLTPDAPTAATQATSAMTPTTAYGQRSPAADAVVGADSAAHAVTQSLTGLLPSTTYHYRLVATSGAGTAYSADATFTTPAQPSSLSTTSNPIASPKPTPTPAPPAIGRTAVAGVVSGTVLVRLPGSSTLQPLGPGQNIPMGSLINVAHDVGKIGISDSVLLKAGPLDSDEWETMKSHTEIGARLLTGSDNPLLQMA